MTVSEQSAHYFLERRDSCLADTKDKMSLLTGVAVSVFVVVFVVVSAFVFVVALVAADFVAAIIVINTKTFMKICLYLLF